MIARLADTALFLGLLATLIVSVIAVVTLWAPAALRREGKWYLEAQLLINGPLLMICIFFYDSNGPVTPFSTIARVLSVASVLIAAFSLVSAIREPRRAVLPYAVVLAIYFLALLVATVLGASPDIPEPYLTTPLIVISFLVHGGFSRAWLHRSTQMVLRMILSLSLLTILLPGAVAFNTVESRTFFGVARLEGVTQHPNTLAFLAVIALLAELLHRNRSVFWTAVAVATIALAQSNTAWAALAAGLLFTPGGVGTLYRRVAIAIATVSAATALFYWRFQEWLVSVFSSGNASTLNGRTRIWDAALNGFYQNPWFGYGPDLLDEDYRHRYLGEFDAAGQAHNQWVQSLGASGAIGTLGLVLVLVCFSGGAIGSLARGYRLPAALMAALLVRTITETPFRPTGPSDGTFILLVVLTTVAITALAAQRDQGSTSPLKYRRTSTTADSR